jgi:ribosomal protein S18 acetylase RimI-like enzyme
VVPVVRLAQPTDLDAIAQFAERVVHDTYDRLVGHEYATELRREWWSGTLAESVDAGLVHVAVDGGEVVGLVERGTIDGEPVIWKLYVDAGRRGQGTGAQLLRIAVAAVDASSNRVLLEHIAANVDAARFYEREGFDVIRIDVTANPATDVVWRSLTRRPGCSSHPTPSHEPDA